MTSTSNKPHAKYVLAYAGSRTAKGGICVGTSLHHVADDTGTREYFVFDGKLTESKLVGALEHRDGYSPVTPGVKRQVQLRRLSDYEVPTSYEVWLKYAPQLQDW